MKREDVMKQVDILLEERKMLLNHRATIKNWSMTIWVAIVLATSSQQLTVSAEKSLLLMVIAVLLFWILESMYAAGTYFFHQHMLAIEGYLSKENDDSEFPGELFVYTRFHKNTLKEKIFVFTKCFFTLQSLNMIYILLLLSSFIFYVVLK